MPKLEGGEVTGAALRRPKTEKLLPQPQVELALGFLTWKALPTKSSTKSTVEPASRSSEVSSTSNVMPWASKRWSSSFILSSSAKL